MNHTLPARSEQLVAIKEPGGSSMASSITPPPGGGRIGGGGPGPAGGAGGRRGGGFCACVQGGDGKGIHCRGSYPVAVAIALARQVDPAYLLQASQWQPQGWRIVKGPTVLKQVPIYNDGTIAGGLHLAVEGYEWDDLQGWGIGGSDGGGSRLRQAIQQSGSGPYADALLRGDVVNFLGIRITSYRLVLLHSQVQLLGWALLILAATFAAIIFIQYLTTGKAAALDDLNRFFAGLFKSVGDAGGAINAGPLETVPRFYLG